MRNRWKRPMVSSLARPEYVPSPNHSTCSRTKIIPSCLFVNNQAASLWRRQKVVIIALVAVVIAAAIVIAVAITLAVVLTSDSGTP